MNDICKWWRNDDLEVVVEVKMLPVGLNGMDGLLRMGPTKYTEYRRRWEQALSGRGIPKAPKPCALKVELHYAKQPKDIESAYASLKAPIDGMKTAGIIEDDTLEHVRDILYVRQIRVNKLNEQKTVITFAN